MTTYLAFLFWKCNGLVCNHGTMYGACAGKQRALLSSVEIYDTLKHACRTRKEQKEKINE